MPGGGLLAGGDGGDAGEALARVRTRAELAALLVALKDRSSKSLRQLADEVGSRHSTISGWLRMTNLPYPAQLPVFRDLLVALGVEEPAPWMEALARVRGERARRGSSGPPPYRGLQSFRRDDARWFFGREQLVTRLHDRLRGILADPIRPNVLAVVGASGAGKSSLLHAGLCTRLEDEGFTHRSLAPGADPFRRLVAVVADLLGTDPADTAAGLADAPGA